jgi:hypothetical protein
MAFEKKAGAKISKQQAMEMIEAFEKENKGKTRSVYFDKGMIQSLIDTPDCVGVKIHFAKKNDINTVVLIPIDELGASLWEDSAPKSKDGGFTALNVGSPCPPYC